jgi:hypothetical protein
MKFGPGNLELKQVEGFYGGLYSRSTTTVNRQVEPAEIMGEDPPGTCASEFVVIQGVEKNDLLLILALLALSIVALTAISAIK